MKVLQGFMVALALITPGWVSVAQTEMLTETELQWAICEESEGVILKKIPWTVTSESGGEISYLDTKELTWLAGGAFLHIENRGQGEQVRTVSKAKVEFQTANSIDFAWLQKHHGECEVDRYSDRETVRCTIRNKNASSDQPWSEDQKALVKKFKPHLNFTELTKWGPFPLRKSRLMDSARDLELTLEQLRLTDQPVSLYELSVHSPSEGAEERYQELSAALLKAGLHLCERQVGKFERLLEVLGN